MVVGLLALCARVHALQAGQDGAPAGEPTAEPAVDDEAMTEPEAAACQVGRAAEDLSGEPDEPKWTIFDQLATHEIWDVLEFSVREMGWFHLLNGSYNSTDELPGPFDDYIYRVELIPTPKQQALEYLDGAGPRPDRFAKVIVFRGTAVPRDIMEYKVGPLPIGRSKKGKDKVGENGAENLSPRPDVLVEKLRKDGEIPYIKRPTESIGVTYVDRVVVRDAYSLKEIFEDITGYCYGKDESNPDAEDCGREHLEWLMYPALDPDLSSRITHVHWYFMPRETGGEEFELHGLPLSFKLNETAVDPEEWYTYDYEYCTQGPFESAQALLDAFKSGQLIRCYSDEWKDPEYDVRWATTGDRRRFRAGSQRASPRTYEPEGPRFKVYTRTSGGGSHFEYLGWEGHVGVKVDNGITFHDIRYGGNRIIYELSLQDQYVAYSGYQGAGQVVYFDSYFGIGIGSFPLKRGVDCPENAEYMSVTKYHLQGAVTEDPDVVCIFEEDSQKTEWRHTHLNSTVGSPRLDAVRRSMLVLRTTATIGNYDYIYDIRFKQDASIEVDVVMAGYMETSFFGPDGQTINDLPFGTRVHQYTFANLHDHLSGWKIDLDVLGTKNSVSRHQVKVGTWEEALKKVNLTAKPPPWHASPVVKYVDSEALTKEFGYVCLHPATTVHTIVNEANTNRWGQPRGYAVINGLTSTQLLPDSHPFTKAAAWTKYHLAVTKRKEEEPNGHAGLYDMNIPAKPITSLDDFLDGESIVGEDLVAWVMMGVQHVPRSEDVPLISNFGTTFFIKPWNYFEELKSMDIGNNYKFDACVPQDGRKFEYSWAWEGAVTG